VSLISGSSSVTGDKLKTTKEEIEVACEAFEDATATLLIALRDHPLPDDDSWPSMREEQIKEELADKVDAAEEVMERLEVATEVVERLREVEDDHDNKGEVDFDFFLTDELREGTESRVDKHVSRRLSWGLGT
jgi:hypothetical protein